MTNLLSFIIALCTVQIEVYTEAGGKPQMWNRKQQAAVEIHSEVRGPYWLAAFDWNETQSILHMFGLVGCFLLTLSLSMLIPRLF